MKRVELTATLVFMTGLFSAQVSAEPLRMSDLQGLGTSQSDVINGLTREFGKQPDGFCINGETSPGGYRYGDGTTICQHYGWWCNKTAGQISYYHQGVSQGPTVVLGSATLYNTSNQTVQQTAAIAGTKTSTTSHSSSITAGMSWESSFQLMGTFSTGIGFNISTTVGQSSSKEESWQISQSVTVAVPPYSQIKVELTGVMTEATMGFSMPIEVASNCYVGANFPSQVNGHYFWAAGGRGLFNRTSGTVSGEIRNATQMDLQLRVGPVEPLSKK